MLLCLERLDMKSFFLMISFICILGYGVHLMADTQIGRCRFYGKKPSHGLTSGTMTIYHSGDLRRTGTRGKVNIWKGTGAVWVIFGRTQDQELNHFEINGALQTCRK